ncbi:uncharacterized protein LOC124174162 [Ischnura elegans]|uniref:uncharacterized protein LOC124174162 n=1 Tax=Ischnura elegans TaxID=197161 RepID=UPI001ED87BD3|nr:uncharacterized protein LOC124174162 [Ischnura elegans]
MKAVKVFVLVAVLGAACGAEERAPDPMAAIHSRCGESLGCTLWELARKVDAFSARDSLDFFSGLFRVQRKAGAEQQQEEEEGAAPPQHPEDVSIELGADTLAGSVERFLETHVVRLLPGAEAENGRQGGSEEVTFDLANLVPEGRHGGRGKLRRFLLPLLLGIKLKAGILFPLFFTAVTLIAVKALGAGLTALLLSSVLGLKALVDSTRTSKLSVEVRPHTTVDHQYHHSHHHVDPHHWTPGWGRDGDDLAYRGSYYAEEEAKN